MKSPGPSPHTRGRWAENLSYWYLRSRGLKPVQRNFSCRMGEIDLVMRDATKIQPNVLVFVEVRYRTSNRYGGAAISIDQRKQQKLIRTAEVFRLQNKPYAQWPARFDVVAITRRKVQWIRAAFTAY